MKKQTTITLALSLWLTASAHAALLYVNTQGNGSGAGSCPVGACGSAIGLVNTATGALSNMHNVTGLNSGEEIFDIAIDTLGQIYGVTNTKLYTINSSTGAASLLGAFGGINGVNGLAFLGSTLYATTNNSSNLYTLNTANGAATNIGGWGATEPNLYSSGDIAFVGSRLFLAATGSSANIDHILELNPANGAVIFDGATPRKSPDKLGQGVDGLKGVGSDGTRLYLAADFFNNSGDIRLIDVNITQGSSFGTVNSSVRWLGTGVANSFGAPGGLANSSAVPEPSAFLLSSLGLGILTLARRKKTQS